MIISEEQLCLDLGITENDFKKFKEKQERECNYKNYCKLRNMPECCGIFKMKLNEIIFKAI